MDEGVWEAARCVRPYLVELLGPVAAVAVDAELARLLNDRADGEDVGERLREVLDAHDATGVFLARVLDDAPAYRPPGLSGRSKSYQGLAGDPQPVGADRFACPCGDYVWYLPEVGTRVPQCPTHRCPLEPM